MVRDRCGLHSVRHCKADVMAHFCLSVGGAYGNGKVGGMVNTCTSRSAEFFAMQALRLLSTVVPRVL